MKNASRAAVGLLTMVLLFGVGFFWPDFRSGASPSGRAFAALTGHATTEPTPTSVYVENYRRIMTRFYRPVDAQKLRFAASKGLFASLGDPHTQFLDPEVTESFNLDTRGDFVGVGAQLSQDPLGARVERVFDDAPAARAGIRKGDLITGVNGANMAGIDVADIVDKIKGGDGTSVRLRVIRHGATQPLNIEVVRERIVVPSAEAKMLPDSDIAYVRVTNFAELTTAQFDVEMDKLDPSSFGGMIIDVRENPGGLLETAADLLARFVANKPVVKMRMRGNRTEVVRTPGNQDRNWRFPVVVLIDENSASASEIFAGVLRDYGRATLVGEHTYGKTTVQNVFSLFDHASAKITIARYDLPSGTDISRRVDEEGSYVSGGLMPDVEVPLDKPLTAELGNPASDSQLRKAMEIVLAKRGEAAPKVASR